MHLFLHVCIYLSFLFIHSFIHYLIHTYTYQEVQALRCQFYCPNCNDEVYDTWVFNNHPETVAVPIRQAASHSGSHLSASQAISEPVNQSVLPISQPANQPASQPAIWAASQAIWQDARDTLILHFQSTELCGRRRPPPRV